MSGRTKDSFAQRRAPTDTLVPLYVANGQHDLVPAPEAQGPSRSEQGKTLAEGGRKHHQFQDRFLSPRERNLRREEKPQELIQAFRQSLACAEAHLERLTRRFGATSPARRGLELAIIGGHEREAAQCVSSVLEREDLKAYAVLVLHLRDVLSRQAESGGPTPECACQVLLALIQVFSRLSSVFSVVSNPGRTVGRGVTLANAEHLCERSAAALTKLERVQASTRALAARGRELGLLLDSGDHLSFTAEAREIAQVCGLGADLSAIGLNKTILAEALVPQLRRKVRDVVQMLRREGADTRAAVDEIMRLIEAGHSGEAQTLVDAVMQRQVRPDDSVLNQISAVKTIRNAQNSLPMLYRVMEMHCGDGDRDGMARISIPLAMVEAELGGIDMECRRYWYGTPLWNDYEAVLRQYRLLRGFIRRVDDTKSRQHIRACLVSLIGAAMAAGTLLVSVPLLAPAGFLCMTAGVYLSWKARKPDRALLEDLTKIRAT